MSSGKLPTQRQLRVGEEIRHALVRLLAEESFRDPALQDVSITVSEVRPGRDLKSATAFVYPLGGGSADEVAAALNRAAAYLRGRLGRIVRLKFTPQLVFHADRSYDRASAIETLLTDDRVARDLPDRPDLPEGGADDGA